MKKSELRKLINELQLQVEQLNMRISNLESETKIELPTVYITYPPAVRPDDNPLYPGAYGWKITCTEFEL